MAKYCGNLGFSQLEEVSPGVLQPSIIERLYYGDVKRNYRRSQNSSESTNDNFALSDEISVLLDPYAMDNFYNLQYVTYMGAKWKVTAVSMAYPRMLLTIGGVYNGDSEIEDS